MKSAKPELSWLGDPTVYSVNKLEPVSDHGYYPTVEAALAREETVWKQSLNGDWKFRFSENADVRPADFYQPDYDAADWVTVQVPGHVQFYGYDQINYANRQYQWDGIDDILPPELPSYNPAFSYLKTFTLDPALKDHTLELIFNGVETAFYVWLNGQFVGYSEDSFTPARFDVTDLVRQDGVNTLAVEVWKASTASWIQDQDMFRFNGIFRDVDLMAWPDVHVRDLKTEQKLYDDYTQADVRLLMTMSNDRAHSFRISVLDKEQKQLAQYETADNDFTFSMHDIHTWSAEDPYLYTIVIEVLDEQGNLCEAIAQRIGLREFKLEDGIMKINGKRIVFRGINRHEFDAHTGHVIDKDTMDWDVKFMKQNNLNAVRTSHYPNQTYWYDLADEYGLYVVDEANLEAHGMWEKVANIPYEKMVPGDNPDWTGNLVDRVQNMAERDKNHPSILIWSPGNESWTGTNLNAMTKYLMDRSDGRIVQYEGCYWNPDKQWEVETQIETRMYPAAKVVEEYLKSSPEKPFVNLEYAHGMGNSLGGLQKYIELEEAWPQYQGGFIWDYADQAVFYKDQYGKEVLGYGGDFRDRQTEYNFSGNGMLFADRSLSPKVQEMKYQYQDMKLTPTDEGFILTNKALFTPSSAYDIVAITEKEGQVLSEEVVETNVAPQCSGFIPYAWKNADEGETVQIVEARLKEDTNYAPRGHVHAMGWRTVGTYEEVPQESGKLKMVKGDKETGVFTDNFEVKFQPTLGMTSLRYDGHEYIARPGRPDFFRAPTDNEMGYRHEYTVAPWAGATDYSVIDSMKATLSEDGTEAKIEYIYKLPIGDNVTVPVTYTIRKPGIITVDVDWKAQKGLPELPRFGHNFRLYNDTDRFVWYGQGPDENYVDRNEGARVGVYESTVQDNMTPYLLPQEAGNRTGVRWLDVVDEQGKGLRFEMKGQPLQASVLPYSSRMLADALHQEELPDPYYTFVTIMSENMGVGGDDSWGLPVLPEYCIPSDQDLHLTFTISQAPQHTRNDEE